MRLTYGCQTSCELCGSDVEWHGKPNREYLYAVGDATIVRGGWVDRGGNRFCHVVRYDENGCELPKGRDRLHKGHDNWSDFHA